MIKYVVVTLFVTTLVEASLLVITFVVVTLFVMTLV